MGSFIFLRFGRTVIPAQERDWGRAGKARAWDYVSKTHRPLFRFREVRKSWWSVNTISPGTIIRFVIAWEYHLLCNCLGPLRELSVRIILIPADIITAFIDNYHLCLGISPEQDYFSVAELNQAMNKYLFDMCSTFAAMTNQGDRVIHYIDLDNLYDNLTRGKNIPQYLNSYSIRIHNCLTKIPGQACISISGLLAGQSN